MSQQTLDLRRSIHIVRQHRILVGIVVVLGILVGGAYAVLNPPMLTSTALVVLPQAPQSTEATSGADPYSYMATQVVIAGSNSVLSGALPDVSPAMSLEKLRGEVQVNSLTSYIISVSVRSKVAADAKATANAVAKSYIAYLGSGNSPVGHVSAQLLEPATSATGTGQLKALLTTGLIGALAGALIGVIVSLAISRNDPRLRERDEIANSIGVPVLASIPVGHPDNAAGWTRLLEDYQPGAVHAWRLRKTLQQLGLLSRILGDGDRSGISSIVVLSLSSDPGALAIGPQLACFAASLGIPTALVIGPQQDVNVTATLRTACAAPPSASQKRANLQVAVCDDGNLDVQSGTALIVVAAVVNEQTPRLPGLPDTTRTAAMLLGVSAGAATAEQLARAAASAATDGREIVGILVADPEPTDKTTGQIPQLAQPMRRRPTRLSGITTEIRR